MTLTPQQYDAIKGMQNKIRLFEKQCHKERNHAIELKRKSKSMLEDLEDDKLRLSHLEHVRNELQLRFVKEKFRYEIEYQRSVRLEESLQRWKDKYMVAKSKSQVVKNVKEKLNSSVSIEETNKCDSEKKIRYIAQSSDKLEFDLKKIKKENKILQHELKNSPLH